MSEPTKKALEEARALLQKHAYCSLGGEYNLAPDDVAKMLADVRKKARDDALERAKATLNDERVDGTVSSEDAAYNAAIDHCIEALDATKDQPDGEA